MRLSDKGLNIIKAVSLISGGFTFLIALTMLFSLIQIKTLKPLDNPFLLSLKEQFDKDPENKDVKEQIRALDLMARRAYFSSRWQVETGSYLLLAGAVIFVFCQRIISGSEKRIPGLPGEKQELLKLRDKKRKYILASAAFISLGAIIASFILRSDLPDPLPVITATLNAGKNKLPANINSDQSLIREPISPEGINTSEKQSTAPEEQIKNDENKNNLNLTENTAPIKPGAGTSFPFFRGQNGRGIVEGTGFPTDWNGKEGKNIKWKLKIPRPGFNSPVIWGNKIFISGADDQGTEVYCIDKRDGKLLWIANAGDIPGSPTVKPETTDDTGLAAPSLATNGSFVCAIFATGNLICLDMEGKRVWAKTLGLPKNHYGHSSSLIIFENVLIVQYDRNDKSTLFGFNIATGELKWETLRDVKISWASPVIAKFNDRYQVILNADPYVGAYDPVTGKEIWRIRTMSAEIGPSVAVNDKMIFVANEYAKLIAIRVGNQPEIAWEDNQFLPEVSSPVATNDLLFVATSYGTVACYNSANGKLLWDHEFEYGFYSSPIINGDLVYILDISGVMHIFKASGEFTPVKDCTFG